jgi:hypothetical protein
MLRWVMQRLDRTVLVAYLQSTTIRAGVPSTPGRADIQNWETKSDLPIELGKVLEPRHSRGLRTVLIIDEAHGLSCMCWKKCDYLAISNRHRQHLRSS